MIQSVERTGNYQTGTDQLITDKNGESRISSVDFTVAMLNELETPVLSVSASRLHTDT